MMPEQIPDCTADKGFQAEAAAYAEGILRINPTIRIDEFELKLKKRITDAYLSGVQAGFRVGIKIERQRKEHKY